MKGHPPHLEIISVIVPSIVHKADGLLLIDLQPPPSARKKPPGVLWDLASHRGQVSYSGLVEDFDLEKGREEGKEDGGREEGREEFEGGRESGRERGKRKEGGEGGGRKECEEEGKTLGRKGGTRGQRGGERW